MNQTSEQPNEKPIAEQQLRPAANRGSRWLFSISVFCILGVFLIWILATIVFAVIGLLTGYLYMPPGRGSSHATELYGVWARIVSAAVLLFYGGIAFLIIRRIRKQRRPKILGDHDMH